MGVHSIYLSKLSSEQREDLKRRLLERQNGVCFICEESIDLALQRDALEIDHIVPIASDGKDEENNFALTHEFCNRTKSASDLRVARVMAKFAKIEEAANKEDGSGRGANLGHVLQKFGGGKKSLMLLVENDLVRYSLDGENGVRITTVPLWKDPLSLRLYPNVKVNPCSFCSCPAISSVPRCPQSTCACLPGAVSKRRTATTRADLRCGRNQSVRIATSFLIRHAVQGQRVVSRNVSGGGGLPVIRPAWR